MKYDDKQFRITPWPDQPVPVPMIWQSHFHIDGDGWLIHAGWPNVQAQLPDELILRDLQDLDCVDLPNVVDFINAHGMITLPLQELTPFEFLPKTKRPKSAAIHAVEAATALRVVRAMTNHWLAHAGGGGSILDAWATEDLPAVDESQAWAWLADCLDRGLKGVHVRLAVEFWYGSTDDMSVVVGEPEIGLYSGLCVQLFNLIVEGLPVRNCANETCDRRFVRQQGRSRQGISRTEGVRFCSSACAKAQTQREYRRRNRRAEL